MLSGEVSALKMIYSVHNSQEEGDQALDVKILTVLLVVSDDHQQNTCEDVVVQ